MAAVFLNRDGGYLWVEDSAGFGLNKSDESAWKQSTIIVKKNIESDIFLAEGEDKNQAVNALQDSLKKTLCLKDFLEKNSEKPENLEGIIDFKVLLRKEEVHTQSWWPISAFFGNTSFKKLDGSYIKVQEKVEWVIAEPLFIAEKSSAYYGIDRNDILDAGVVCYMGPNVIALWPLK